MQAAFVTSFTRWLAVVVLTLVAAVTACADNALSLAGSWRFQLDRADVGVSERWFARTLPDKFMLPGSLPAAGIGDDISTNTPWTGGIVDRSWFTALEFAKYRQPGNVKVPFWLQPEKYYAGAAWFQRDIEVPADWRGKRVVLFLERVHWESRVWVDDRLVGTNHSLSTPHEYDLGQLAPGRHTLSIRVDNRRIVDIGENSHAITDHTQGNWNGIVGRIELRTTPLVWIEDVQVYPDFEKKSALVKLKIGNMTGKASSGRLVFNTRLRPFYSVGNPIGNDGEQVSPLYLKKVSWETNGSLLELNLSLATPVEAWDEFQPALRDFSIELTSDWGHDHHDCIYGARDFKTDGTQFTLNGRKTFLRGTLECCIFPKTGHPPTDVDSWKRIIRVAKSYGLNLIRFHSYCPPEAAFQAADELGFYFGSSEKFVLVVERRDMIVGDGRDIVA